MTTPQAGSYLQRALTLTPAVGNPELAECWRRIHVPPEVKRRLLNHVLLALEIRASGVSRAALPLHGLVVLAGAPGVGKSSLARGVAGEVARRIDSGRPPIRLITVNPHLLASELLGRTQRNIIAVFQDELPALVGDGPAVLVLDEVEAVAVTRAGASLSVNPIDVHRGTAALLAAFDWLASEMPKVVVVATTNLPETLDAAVLSRADVVLDVPRPGRAAIEAILADTLDALGEVYPGCQGQSADERLSEVARLLDGCDGRQARKFVAEALASRTETALSPGSLTVANLLDAAATARETRAG